MWEYRNDLKEGTKILSRRGAVGIATGGQGRCMLEGCTGMRITVRWKDGKITKPCSRGLTWNKRRKTFQIE
jgi:hypothetical protein